MMDNSLRKGNTTMNETYEFTDGKFTPASFPEEWEAAEPGTDWEDCLHQSGWCEIATIPERSVAGVPQVKAVIHRKLDPRTRILVEIHFADSAEVVIFCSTRLDLMILLRDFVYPLCGHGDRGLLVDQLVDLTHCLLDEERGCRACRA